MNTREKRIFSIGLLFVVACSLFLAQTVLGTKVDRVLSDTIRDTHIRDEIILVGIDDASLADIGAWPWDRTVFAQTLETLTKKGVRLVVFDILFLEERIGDTSMRSVLERNKTPVVFASKLDKDSRLLQSVYRDSEYAVHGVAHVYPDDDGKVRTIPLYQKDGDDVCHKSLAYQAFSLYTKSNSSLCDTTPHAFLFQSTSPKIISFLDIKNGAIPDNAVKDKVVIIGSNSLDIEDHFVGLTGEKIPGMYVHASIFTTLLNNSFLQPIGPLFYITVLLLFFVFSMYVIFKLTRAILQGILILLGTVILIVLSLFVMTLSYSVSLSLLLFPYILVSLYAIMFRYTVTEKKNSFIKELFGQYVHPKVLTHILKNNNLKLGGEKKYITILFSDIRGFTTMTENMSPEELVETLNSYLETMSPLIMNNEGVIDKYIGDAIMAFWNAPVDVTHHEEKAVRASLNMVDALREIQKKFPLEIGIGLHAGEAIVGNIGSRTRINYTIIGDAVNACSRLEGLTKKYGLRIIASKQIKDAITSTDIIWRRIDNVRVKGKTEVMHLYEPMKKTEENEQLVSISEAAFTHYLAGQFKEAATLYKRLDDMYSTKMLERISILSEDSPLSWTGVWDWDEK